MSGAQVNMRRLCLTAAGVCCILSARQVRADVGGAPPDPRAEVQTAPLVIKVSKDQVLSRIVIPRKFLAEAAAANGEDVAASTESRTIIAGIAFSLVVAGGGLGLAFIRRRNMGRSATVALALLVAGLCLVGTTLADLVPPDTAGAPQPSGQTPEIVVEATDTGDSVIFVIGRESAAELNLK